MRLCNTRPKLLKPDGATTAGGSSFPILPGCHSQSRLSDELLPPLPFLPSPNVHLPNGPRLHLPIFCHGWRLAQTLSTSFITVSRHNLHYLALIYGYRYRCLFVLNSNCAELWIPRPSKLSIEPNLHVAVRPDSLDCHIRLDLRVNPLLLRHKRSNSPGSLSIPSHSIYR